MGGVPRGAVTGRIQEDRYGCDHVVWSEFTVHCLGDVEPPAELRFRTSQYVAEIVRCHADRSWESASRRIAREVTGALDADPGILGQWDLGLRRAQPNKQHGAVSMQFTDGSADYMTTFENTADAATIIARLRSRDPRESAEHTFPRSP